MSNLGWNSWRLIGDQAGSNRGIENLIREKFVGRTE